MAEERIKDEFMEMVANEIIETDERFRFILDNDIRVGYLMSDKAKTAAGMTVFGECEKVPDKQKVFVPYDFLIVFYAPNCEGFSRDQYDRLMEHELQHIGVGKNGKLRIVPHDVQDFRSMLDRYGERWLGVN